MTATRRQLLGRGALAAGATVLPAGLLAAPALAQADGETDAIERLIGLEQATELAYSITEQDEMAGGELTRLAGSFRPHEGAHAEALSSAIDQLGVEAPDSSDDPASYDSLKGFEQASSDDARVDFLIGLEEDLISAYEEETANLEALDLFRTAAQIAASHAQHLVALRFARGDDPADAVELPPPAAEPPPDGASAAGEDAGPKEDAGADEAAGAEE